MQNMIRFFSFVILIFSCSSLQELHAFTNNTIVYPPEGLPGPTESVWQITGNRDTVSVSAGSDSSNSTFFRFT